MKLPTFKWPRSFWFCVPLAIIALQCSVGQPVQGQLFEPIEIPASEKQRVEFWLQPAWKKSLANREQSAEMFSLAPTNSPSVLLAYAVNRFRHNRVSEAQETLQTALRLAPENLDARMLLIWAKAVRDEFNSAVIDIRSLAKTIQKRKLPAAKLDNTYRRIGRLLGYLQGPVGDQVNQEILRVALDELSVMLAPAHQNLITQEIEAIAAEYEARLEQLGMKVKESVKAKDVEKNSDRQLIERENEQLKKEVQRIQNRQTDVQTEGEKKLDAALAQAEPLQSELNALEIERRSVHNNIQALQTALFFQQNNPNGSLLQDQLLLFRIQDNFFALGNIGNRADALLFDLDRVAIEADRIRNRYDGHLNDLERDLKTSGLQQRRNSKRLGKLARPTKPNSKKIASLKNRIQALNSYDQLPLELYRADLLDAVAAP